MFFDNFSKLCEEKGVSVKQAAKEIGLSNSIGTKWKKHPETIPNGSTLEKVAKYFNCSVAFLLSGDEKENSAAPIGAALHVETQYDGLSDDNRAMIDDLIAKLYKSQSDD